MEIARRTHSNLIDIVRIIFQQIKDDLAVRYSVCPCYMSKITVYLLWCLKCVSHFQPFPYPSTHTCMHTPITWDGERGSHELFIRVL